MDIGWGMDKTHGMTWTTFPRANFGLFLVKETNISAKVSNSFINFFYIILYYLIFSNFSNFFSYFIEHGQNIK